MGIKDEDLLTLLEYYYTNIDNGFSDAIAKEYLKGKVEFPYGLVGYHADNSNGLFELNGVEAHRITDAGVVKMNRLREAKNTSEKEIEFKQQLVQVNKSVIDTNDSVTTTNNNQKYWFGATLIVAIFGAMAQWLTYSKDNKIRSVEQQLITKDSLLQQKQKEPTSLKIVVDSLIIQEQYSLTNDSTKVKH